MKLNATTIRFLYLEQGHSFERISKEFNFPIEKLLIRASRLGLIGNFSSILVSKQISDRSMRRYLEFSAKVKKSAFILKEGRCEICHNLIGNGLLYKDATYHHKIPVFRGGLATLNNCMVLHDLCHIEFFEKLHGIKYDPSKYDLRKGHRVIRKSH